MRSPVWVNGVESDGRIDVADSSILRGDGCFEVLRAYNGRVFAIEDHLDRLESSASKLEIPLPPRTEVAGWVNLAAKARPNGAIRVVVTRGSALPGDHPETTVIVFSHQWNRGGDTVRLAPVRAPWHSAGEDWELTGAKILSYAPNLSATRSAQRAGFDDAFLVSTGDVVLEGPTFSVAWVCDGVLETPMIDLGILDSITRRHVLDLAAGSGIQVREDAWTLDRLESAAEVMALSTIRQVQAVTAVGDLEFKPGEMTMQFARSYAQLVNSSD